MAFKKQLIRITVSEAVFNILLDMYHDNVRKVNCLDEFLCGYKDKREILLCGNELIIQAKYLYYAVPSQERLHEGWKQLVLTCDINQKEAIIANVIGSFAWNYMMKVLEHEYTDVEIEETFNRHVAAYAEEKAQVHYLNCIRNKILKFANCVYHDINKAHADAIIAMFPKSKERILAMIKPDNANLTRNKKIINYFVGMLCRKNHRDTYNWIVQRTTKTLEDFNNKYGGTVVYANTDGIIVSCPTSVYAGSKEIGDFKLEYSGDVYTLRGDNYQIVQYGDEIKGNMPLTLRPMVDLRQSKSISYDRQKINDHFEYTHVEVKNYEVRN